MGGWKPNIRYISNSTLGGVELTWSGDGVELELDKKNDDGGCGGSAYKLMKLHASSGNCMQAHVTACKLM